MPATRSLPEIPLPTASDALCLSTAHIPPRQHRRGNLRLAVGGNFASVDFGKSPGRIGGGGLRGVIKEFSPGSRRRLMVLLNSIDRSRVAKPFFVTLTWHETWPATSTGRQRQLDALLKRLERSFGRFATIWRVEWKQRLSGQHAGTWAPHMHLLVFIDPRELVGGFLPKKDLLYAAEMRLRNRVAFYWNEIVAPGDDEHLAVALHRKSVVTIETWRGASWYASKYMSKLESFDPGAEGIGRNWGTRNKELLNISMWSASVSIKDATTLRRIFRRYSGARYRNHRGDLQSASCFLGASTSLRLLRWLGYYADPPPERGSARSGASTQPRDAGWTPADTTLPAAREGVRT